MAAKNVILTLLALCGIAYGQTRSLLVDTSGIVQYTNTVQWQGALSFGTNTAAQATTRSNLSLPLSALTNATGAALIEAILPAYTNNANKFLSLNTNASALVWTNVGGLYANAQEAMLGLYFASTNDNRINLFYNGTNANNAHIVIGSGPAAFGTTAGDSAVVIGTSAQVTNGGVAIGRIAIANNGVAIGPQATAQGQSVAIGRFADARGGLPTNTTNVGSVAIGSFAVAQEVHGVAIGSAALAESRGVSIGHLAQTGTNSGGFGGIAIGYGALSDDGQGIAIGEAAVAEFGVSIGRNADSMSNSIAIGDAAFVDSYITGIQIGTGSNTVADSIQFYNAGSVSTNQWSSLAQSTALGQSIMKVSTNATNGQVLIYTNSGVAWLTLSLGTASTNDASAFQPASANLTNLANNNGGNLTNVSVDLTAVLPAYTNNAGKVLAVATGATNVEWIAVSNTVTDASTLTNFPASILQTSSAETNFPSFLLRTNGNASGLTFPASLLTTNGNGAGVTNLTAANVVGTVALASNVSGTVAIANGGTGASDVTNARINLLPSYTGNSNRVLALNSNATELVWAVDGGGQADLANVTNTLALANGGTGATNASGAVSNLGISPGGGAQLGTTATNAASRGAAIGYGAQITNVSATTEGGGAVGYDARASVGFAGGQGSRANTGAAVGFNATAEGAGGAALGRAAVATSGNGGAVGREARTTNGFAGGYLAHALADQNVQLGTGTNSSNNTIQFMSAGSVDTNEWSRIAALSTYPTTNIQVTVVGGATNTLVFSNGVLVNVTTP